MLSHAERDFMQFKKIALVLASGLVFAGCSLLPGSTDEVPEAMMEETPAEETMLKDEAMVDDENMVGGDAMVEDEEAMMEDGTITKLVAENFTFGTDEIKVKQGEKLVVSVMNKEGIHDFVIDELDVNSGIITQGDTMEIEIPTDKPGTYEYYCSVNQHRQMGMKGTLIIE